MRAKARTASTRFVTPAKAGAQRLTDDRPVYGFIFGIVCFVRQWG